MTATDVVEADPEDAESEGDDRPPIEDEDRAELDLDDLAEDIENETAPGDTDTPDENTEDAPEADDTASEAGEGLNVPQGPEHSVGDQYVAVLALLSATLVEEFGDEGSEDPDVVREKVQDIATQEPFDLAASVDTLLAQSGVGSDLPPGKALVLGTAIVVALIVLPETNLVSVAMERLQGEVEA